jgi:NTP pyrophosphatase (non-canonical NTP hydrolase)
MNSNEYSKYALRTASDNFNADERLTRTLLHGALGMAGESGEVADLVKKVVFNGRTVDREKILAECGDVLWYMNLVITILGSSFEDVMRANIRKLEARYPGLCYDQEGNVNRDHEAEDAAVKSNL